MDATSEFQRETAGDRLAVGLDVAEGEFGVEPVFELGDPALGPIHPSGDVLLGKPGTQPLADELRDDLGPLAGGTDSPSGLGRNDAGLAEVFRVPVAGRAEGVGILAM